MHQNTLKISLASLILALGLIGSSYMLSRFYLRLEKEKVITVKGSAQKRLISDKAAFTAEISVQGASVSQAYKTLQTNTAQLAPLILSDRAILVTSENVVLDKVYQKNEQGEPTNTIDYYVLSQRFRISSNDVKTIQALSQEISQLLAKGIQIVIYGPEYYISELAGIKMDLLAAATNDGSTRAQVIAANSGGKIGRLVEAQQGIFQITTPDSTDVADYGVYDTSTIEKDIKAVVTLKYLIE
ncbi:MAG: SIMPL domain-containing protein [Planctomycetaceae bacterium]|nr:SIMPL domain-containing protein [Planctomycetaceae bacterium]